MSHGAVVPTVVVSWVSTGVMDSLDDIINEGRAYEAQISWCSGHSDRVKVSSNGRKSASDGRL